VFQNLIMIIPKRWIHLLVILPLPLSFWTEWRIPLNGVKNPSERSEEFKLNALKETLEIPRFARNDSKKS